jgi:hypothetical protein
MPTWPTPPGRRSITIELPEDQIQHLDAQAAYVGCSRAAHFRRLIVDDRSRPTPPAILPAAISPGPSARVVCFELRDDLLQHLDTQAAAVRCSRSAYARHLILSDIRRQGPVGV